MSKVRLKVGDPIMDYDGKPLKESEVKISIPLVEELRKASNTKDELLDLLKKEAEKNPLTYKMSFTHP